MFVSSFKYMFSWFSNLKQVGSLRALAPSNSLLCSYPLAWMRFMTQQIPRMILVIIFSQSWKPVKA